MGGPDDMTLLGGRSVLGRQPVDDLRSGYRPTAESGVELLRRGELHQLRDLLVVDRDVQAP